jgi:hypothetical protein
MQPLKEKPRAGRARESRIMGFVDRRIAVERAVTHDAVVD